jgi:uncharacterized delta-60 repeat protein
MINYRRILSSINKKIIFLICTFTLINSFYAQGVKNSFNNGHHDNKAYSTNIDDEGNVYVTGYTLGPTNNNDICTIKYNSNGVQQWVRTYNGSGNGDDKAYAITIDNHANVYVTGYSTALGGLHKITTIKYDTHGALLWAAVYNSTGNSESCSIIVDKKGNVYVTGFTSSVSTNTDFCTIKYNQNGHQQWAAVYNSSNNGEDKAYAITIDKSYNVYVTGYSTSYDNSNHATANYTTIKYNREGDRKWVAKYDGPGNGDDKAYAITIDKYGFIYITGTSTGVNGYTSIATIKYDSEEGEQEWVKRYNGSNYGSGGNAITVDDHCNIYVTGWSNERPDSNADYTTIKYTSDGEQKWVSSYNSPSNSDDIAKSISLDNQGNVYITGSSKQIGPVGLYYHYATVKYNNRTGVQQWAQIYTYAFYEDDASYITVDNAGNAFVTGSSMRDRSNYDYATLKYNSSGTQQWAARFNYSSIGLGNESSQIQNFNQSDDNLTNSKIIVDKQVPENFELLQNFPNPFNPTTKISFVIPESNDVELKIFDINGKEVKTLINGYKPAGIYSVDFDGTGFASGVYFYKIKSGSFSDMKKMIMIK